MRQFERWFFHNLCFNYTKVVVSALPMKQKFQSSEFHNLSDAFTVPRWLAENLHFEISPSRPPWDFAVEPGVRRLPWWWWWTGPFWLVAGGDLEFLHHRCRNMYHFSIIKKQRNSKRTQTTFQKTQVNHWIWKFFFRHPHYVLSGEWYTHQPFRMVIDQAKIPVWNIGTSNTPNK